MTKTENPDVLTNDVVAGYKFECCWLHVHRLRPTKDWIMQAQEEPEVQAQNYSNVQTPQREPDVVYVPGLPQGCGSNASTSQSDEKMFYDLGSGDGQFDYSSIRLLATSA